ncbi:pre-peptidase C-terminal domain-containing protein [Anatilimnocola sp. NA78]|uniref:pre-peptidase C-terminal domain-containing protein n=1 Tax=Anatilimnocola sp. NA78 TaxID=3415683 RepID=UPI003CE5C451
MTKLSLSCWSAIVGCCLLVLLHASTAVAQPAITGVSPAAVKPGTTTQITFSGTKLDGAIEIWTSFPARCEWVAQDPKAKDVKSLTCKLTVPAGASVGPAGIVIASIRGMSDILPVMVDDLATVAESGNNHAPATPQEITLPVAIEGSSDGPASDYFAFNAKANERLSLELIAARLGSDFDGVLRVLDAQGNELLLFDDDAAAGADCRGVFTAPADGKYLIELRDNRFKANGRYRLRLGDFPLVTTTYPIGVQVGVPTALHFTGPQVDKLSAVSLLTTSSTSRRLPISTSVPGVQGSGWGTIVAGNLPLALESPTAKDPLALPVAVHGVLAVPREKDEYSFSLAKDQRVMFAPISRSVGSAAIITLRLLNSAGAQVAEAAVTENEEEPLSFVAPAEGIYKLVVSDLTDRGGADFTYRIEASTGPSFQLIRKLGDAKTKADLNNNRTRFPISIAGGGCYIDVVAQRSGYDGAIQLSIDSPRSGWQLVNNVIAAKANETRLYLVPPADWQRAEIARFRIVGEAVDDESISPAVMSTTAQTRLAKPALIYPPAYQDGLLLASGLQAKSEFYTLSQGKPEIKLLRQIGQTQLTLAMQRNEATFKDVPLTVLVTKLPPGVTSEVKRNGNGPAETYEIILKSAKDIAAGRHALRYFTYAELAGTGLAVVSNDVVVNLVDPLVITLTPAGPLVAGQKQKVKIAVTRHADDRQPVDLAFKSLPAGVTGPDKVNLAVDQNEVEVELSAVADAAPVMFKELVVVATSKAAEQNVTGESAPAALEVKKP